MGRSATYFTTWWTNYRRAVKVYESDLDYHSFRHGVTTKLFGAQVPRDIVDELTGSEGRHVATHLQARDTDQSLVRSDRRSQMAGGPAR
jgi:hypothetical protein